HFNDILKKRNPHTLARKVVTGTYAMARELTAAVARLINQTSQGMFGLEWNESLPFELS
ncbi:hypothetical protein BaRGS_00025067, partial [Batillaria attramentaria]